MMRQGRWRIVEMPDDEADFPDMMEPAYILFDSKGSRGFAFGGGEATFIAAVAISSTAC